MNLTDVLAGGFARLPDECRGEVTFKDKDGNETTADAVATPARGTHSDGFKEGAMIRDKHRTLSVIPIRLRFTPLTGMTATWAGEKWNVLGAVPLNPGGGTISLYRVVLGK